MIIEELFEFNREVLSKEKNREERVSKLGEFLYSKGFKSTETQQLLIDCLASTDQYSLIVPIAMLLAVIFSLLLILSHVSEIYHPVLFAISAGVIAVLLLSVILITRQMISNERRQISKLIRRMVNGRQLFFQEN